MPKANRAFWKKKLEGNRARDSANWAFLKRAGWRVIRLWEHDIERFPERCARRVFNVVQLKMRKNGR
jgi:DNA mismatch endonuclease (patch repair protein)